MDVERSIVVYSCDGRLEKFWRLVSAIKERGTCVQASLSNFLGTIFVAMSYYGKPGALFVSYKLIFSAKNR